MTADDATMNVFLDSRFSFWKPLLEAFKFIYIKDDFTREGVYSHMTWTSVLVYLLPSLR